MLVYLVMYLYLFIFIIYFKKNLFSNDLLVSIRIPVVQELQIFIDQYKYVGRGMLLRHTFTDRIIGTHEEHDQQYRVYLNILNNMID